MFAVAALDFAFYLCTKQIDMNPTMMTPIPGDAQARCPLTVAFGAAENMLKNRIIWNCHDLMSIVLMNTVCLCLLHFTKLKSLPPLFSYFNLIFLSFACRVSPKVEMILHICMSCKTLTNLTLTRSSS